MAELELDEWPSKLYFTKMKNVQQNIAFNFLAGTEKNIHESATFSDTTFPNTTGNKKSW